MAENLACFLLPRPASPGSPLYQGSDYVGLRCYFIKRPQISQCSYEAPYRDLHFRPLLLAKS